MYARSNIISVSNRVWIQNMTRTNCVLSKVCVFVLIFMQYKYCHWHMTMCNTRSRHMIRNKGKWTELCQRCLELIIYKYIFVIANEYFNSNLLKICFNDLLAPGGTIAMDNALLEGKPYLSDTSPNEGVTKCNDMIVTRDDIYYVSIM